MNRALLVAAGEVLSLARKLNTLLVEDPPQEVAVAYRTIIKECFHQAEVLSEKGLEVGEIVKITIDKFTDVKVKVVRVLSGEFEFEFLPTDSRRSVLEEYVDGHHYEFVEYAQPCTSKKQS